MKYGAEVVRQFQWTDERWEHAKQLCLYSLFRELAPDIQHGTSVRFEVVTEAPQKPSERERYTVYAYTTVG
jgi:hypothetical protein